MTLDEGTLRELYVQQQLSLNQMSPLIDAAPVTIWKYLGIYSIPIRSRSEGMKLSIPRMAKTKKGKRNSPSTEIKKGQHLSPATELKKGLTPKSRKLFLPRETFEDLYIGQKLSTIEVAQRLKVRAITILRWLRRYNIPVRTRSEAHKLLVGPRHPCWQGGRIPYYGVDWREQRRLALRRDGYRCVRCGRGKTELGRSPEAHHIIPYRVSHSNALDNLLTLCYKHHRQAEMA